VPRSARILPTLFVTCSLLTLGACMSKQEAHLRDARQFSEISVLKSEFQPRPGDTFAWYAPLILSSAAIEPTPELRQMLMQLVEEELRKKGYQVLADQAEADYIIGAAIVDPEDEASETLRNFFRLFPSVHKSHTRLPNSMALIAVIRPEDVNRIGQVPDGSSIALWRAAIAAFVLGDTVSPEVRTERYRTLTAKLMHTLP